jgi:hypothetical protein
MVPYFLGRRGWAHLAQGDHAAAAVDATDALTLATSTGQRFHTVELLRLLACAQRARGDSPERWRATLEEAMGLAEQQAAPMLAGRVVLAAPELSGSAEAVIGLLDADWDDPTYAALGALVPSTTEAR